MSNLPASEGWRRLHPASPVVRIGRLVPALFLLLVISNAHSAAENQTAETDYLIVFAAFTVVYGYIHWMVTRWRFEGDTLRIETGLIRKDSSAYPSPASRRSTSCARCSAGYWACRSCASAWPARARPTGSWRTSAPPKRRNSGWLSSPATAPTTTWARRRPVSR